MAAVDAGGGDFERAGNSPPAPDVQNSGESVAPVVADGGAGDVTGGGPQDKRGPRPNRPNRHGPGGRPGPQHRGRKQRHGGPDSPGEGGEPRAFDPDAQPRFNDNRAFDPNRNKGQGGGGPGKPRFDRGPGGQPRGNPQGRGGQGNAGAQGKWGGKSQQPYAGAGPERGNEARRSRGMGPQHEEPVRLSRLICERGLCSQREADAYINRGWIIVNGERITAIAARVHPAAEIRLAPEARGEQSRRVTLLLNKPAGTPALAEAGEASALALIRADSLDDRYDGPAFHASHLDSLLPAGGLDAEDCGLLVLTQDARVVEQIGGGAARVEREYLVETLGEAGDAALAEIARAATGEGMPATRVVREAADRLRIARVEGADSGLRKHCELAGLKVKTIKRIRIGDVRLGDVPSGKWRYLRDDEAF